MQAQQLKKNVGRLVKLRPRAKIKTAKFRAEEPDDLWRIEKVDANSITLRNTRTEHSRLFGLDHFHHFASDYGPENYVGFLVMNSQIHIHGATIYVEPLPPGPRDPVPGLTGSARVRLGHKDQLAAATVWVEARNDAPKVFVSPGDTFSQTFFSLEHLHPDRIYGIGSSGFEKEFRVGDIAHADFETKLRVINKLLPFSSGSFAIEQNECSWHGFGVREFLEVLRARHERYSRFGGERWHHSEDFSFLSEFRDGLFLCTGRQTASQETEATYYDIEFSFLFRGLPVRLDVVQSLCVEFGSDSGVLRPTQYNHEEIGVWDMNIPVKPVGRILEDDWVCGVVVKNPFLDNPGWLTKLRGEHDNLQGLARAGHLICEVQDHYPIAHSPTGFRLTSIETLSLSRRLIYNLRTWWEDCPEDHLP